MSVVEYNHLIIPIIIFELETIWCQYLATQSSTFERCNNAHHWLLNIITTIINIEELEPLLEPSVDREPRNIVIQS